MRFNVVAAIVLGILIPTLETVRRGIGYWSANFTTMSQIERHFWSDVPEPRSGIVLVTKLLLLLVCAVALSQSVRREKATFH